MHDSNCDSGIGKPFNFTIYFWLNSLILIFIKIVWISKSELKHLSNLKL